MPFTPGERETLCDGLYTPGVDHVYIPYRRQDVALITLLENAAAFRERVPDKCLDPAIRVFCHYYLPPCGNTTLFEPPTSVCMEVCNYLGDLCPSEWEQAVTFFEVNEALFYEAFINCSNTGEYLDPNPYCCSDVGVDIRMYILSVIVCSKNLDDVSSFVHILNISILFLKLVQSWMILESWFQIQPA